MEYTGTIILAICLIGIFLSGIQIGRDWEAKKYEKKHK